MYLKYKNKKKKRSNKKKTYFFVNPDYFFKKKIRKFAERCAIGEFYFCCALAYGRNAL